MADDDTSIEAAAADLGGDLAEEFLELSFGKWIGYFLGGIFFLFLSATYVLVGGRDWGFQVFTDMGLFCLISA
jgi:hypothetical protein